MDRRCQAGKVPVAEVLCQSATLHRQNAGHAEEQNLHSALKGREHVQNAEQVAETCLRSSVSWKGGTRKPISFSAGFPFCQGGQRSPILVLVNEP